jgi:hypothetical protein
VSQRWSLSCLVISRQPSQVRTGHPLAAVINAAQPEGIRYAWCLLPDGETFVTLVQVDDGVENPIPGFPEFRELQEGLKGWLAEPPNARPMTVVGSYRLF